MVGRLRFHPRGGSLCLTITLSLLASLMMSRAAQAIPTVRLVEQPLVAGQDGYLEILIENPEDVSGVQMRFLFDPANFNIPDPAGTTDENQETNGSVIPSGLALVNYHAESGLTPGDPATQGKRAITFAVAGVSGTNQSGRVLRLKFHAAATVPNGAITVITPDTVGPSTGNPGLFVVSNSKGVILPAEVAITAPPPPLLMGDLNGDGRVNVLDVRILMMAIVGLTTLTPQQIIVGDLNGDGKIYIQDARLLLKKSVGL